MLDTDTVAFCFDITRFNFPDFNFNMLNELKRKMNAATGNFIVHVVQKIDNILIYKFF